MENDEHSYVYLTKLGTFFIVIDKSKFISAVFFYAVLITYGSTYYF